MSEAYNQAISIWPLTDDAIERGAKALAQALAGGDWLADFTDGQRNFWRERVRKATEATP